MLGVILAAGFAAQTIDGWDVSRVAERCEARRALGGDLKGAIALSPRIVSEGGAEVTVEMDYLPTDWYGRLFALTIIPSTPPSHVGNRIAQNSEGTFEVRARLDRDQLALLSTATALDFDMAGAPRRRIMLPSSAAVMSALEQCRTSVLRDWGVDPGQLITVDNATLLPFLEIGDIQYIGRSPTRGVTSYFVLGVAADGKPASCKVVVSTRLSGWDGRTCRKLMKNARFAAAPAGTPQRWVVGSWSWRIA